MHIHIYMRALRALTVVTGFLVLLAFASFTHAQSSTIGISDVSISDGEDRGVTASFSLTSPIAQEGVRYGIAVYYDAGDGSPQLIDVVSGDETLTLAANESIVKTLTYNPPESLAGDFSLTIILRSLNDTVIGEYALGTRTFEFGGIPVLFDVQSCQFQAVASSGVVRCGIGNMDTDAKTVRASVTLRAGGMLGAPVSASVENEVTIAAGTIEQIDFAGFSTALAGGMYAAELTLSNVEGDTLLRKFYTGAVGGAARITDLAFNTNDSSVLEVSVDGGNSDMMLRVVSDETEGACANVSTGVVGAKTSVLLPNCANESLTVSIIGTNGTVLDTKTITAPEARVQPEAQQSGNTMYIGALLLALLLLLGVLVFSRRRAAMMVFALLASTALLAASPFAWAQEEAKEPGSVVAETSAPFEPPSAELESCFEYYRFGSVPVVLTSDTLQLAQGAQLQVKGTITNENPYPVDNVTVYGKIFYKKNFDKTSFGPDVIDWFVIADNINLKAGETQSVSYTWHIPGDLQPGNYQLASFVASHDRFNLTGLSFSNDVVGNLFNFSVVGEDRGAVRFNNTQTVLNGNGYHAAIFPARSDVPETGVPVVGTIENTTSEAFTGTVRWNIYAWDGINESHRIDTSEMPITLGAGERTTVSYTVTDDARSVYYILGELLPETEGDAKSLLTVRYINPSEGYNDESRLAFIGASSYPAVANETKIFACFHSAGTKPSEDVRVEVSAQPLDFISRIFTGKEIGSVTYEGTAPGRVSAISIPMMKDSSDFSVTARLYQKDQLVDEVTVVYACEMFNDSCFSLTHWLLLPALALIIIGFLVLYLLRRRNNGGTSQPMRQPTEDIIGSKNTL